VTLPFIIAVASLSAIVGIWFGYPVLIWAIASIKRDGARENSALASTRFVSVIVATRDGADVVRARLVNLLETEHPEALLEVVVALDHDGALCSAEELRDFGERVRVIVGDAPGGKASGLNAGVRAAGGEILVLADAHQRFDRATIPNLVSAMEDPRFGAVSGALELGRVNNRRSPVDWYWAMEKWLRHNESRVHSTVGVTGAVYATRRALWPAIPAGTLLDDVFVPMSLVLSGHRIGFNYAARAFDVRAFNAGNEGARKTRTLTGVLQLLRLLPDILSVKRNPIAVQFVAHKLLRLLTPLLSAIFAVSSLIVAVQFALQATATQRIVALLLLVSVFALPATRRRIVAIVRWAISLQMATTRAVYNGVGGRWSVWTKSKH
jgi:biofilm PGA synthesis N-glycosyltransferase PgaC